MTHFTEEGNISILTRNECIANNLGYDEGSNDCGNHSSCDRNCINLNDEHLNESDNARHDVDLPKASEALVYCQNFNRMRGSSKIKQIHKNILASSFSIILGTETSWDESIKSEEVFGCDYNVFRDDRDFLMSQRKSGGGVLIAVSSKFNSEIICSSKFKEFEHVWVKVNIENEKHVFASVYFPPDHANKHAYDSFFKNAEDIISGLPPEVKVHIYGDFNQRNADFIPDFENEGIMLPVVGENETLQLIFDKIAILGLNQINHVKNRQNCYLDFLLTNIQEDFYVNESIAPLWKNEAFHTALEYSLFIHNNCRPTVCEYEDIYEYDNANYENIKNRINLIDWQSLIREENNVEKAVDIFYSLLMEIIREEVPLKRKKLFGNSKNPIWFNRNIRNLKNRKQKAHKIYKKHGSDDNMQKYLDLCEQLNIAINSALEEYNRKIESDIKSCPRSFFNYTKTKLKSNNLPSKMQLDDKDANNPEEICHLFSTFFQEIYTTFSEEDRDLNYFSFFPAPSNDISVHQISVQDILSGLKGLDATKSAGPDEIPPVFMKKLAVELTSPLFWLFNMSLKSGKFPKIWKKSFLVPIYKSGKKTDIRNYRGIAIISCIPKLFESIVNRKLFGQLRNRITNAQHGFFKGRSTSTNLLEFTNYTLNAMDNGNYVEALYTDFSKAFDRIDISMLLFKLEKIGFDKPSLNWIQSYLTNRQQIVRYNGKKSNPIQVTSGVPQGSHLGPLLFILYVNDISYILKHINILIYADDMKLFMEIKYANDIDIYLSEISIFDEWCSKSLLQLNVKKCNLITFSRKRNTEETTVVLGNQIVEKCDRVRDLGVILDSKLTFIDHYNTIIHKATNMLGFIKRFGSNFNDPYTIKTLYVAYVRSILEYCSIVWSPFMKTHEERLESVQKQFLLYALRKLGWTSFPLPSYESRCMLIDIQTLKKRREFAMVSFVNDIVSHRIDSPNLLNSLNFYTPSRQLRNRNLFFINHRRTNYAKFSPLNRMMSLYNQHCETIDLTMSRSNLRIYFNSVRYSSI